MEKLTLQILDNNFMVCRFDRDLAIPKWASEGEFFSVTKTTDELSIVCEECDSIGNVKCERGWKALKIKAILDFSLIGVLASLSNLLAKNNVSIFTISTYDTDYILVKTKDIKKATEVFAGEGHIIIN